MAKEITDSKIQKRAVGSVILTCGTAWLVVSHFFPQYDVLLKDVTDAGPIEVGTDLTEKALDFITFHMVPATVVTSIADSLVIVSGGLLCVFVIRATAVAVSHHVFPYLYLGAIRLAQSLRDGISQGSAIGALRLAHRRNSRPTAMHRPGFLQCCLQTVATITSKYRRPKTETSAKNDPRVRARIFEKLVTAESEGILSSEQWLFIRNFERTLRSCELRAEEAKATLEDVYRDDYPRLRAIGPSLLKRQIRQAKKFLESAEVQQGEAEMLHEELYEQRRSNIRLAVAGMQELVNGGKFLPDDIRQAAEDLVAAIEGMEHFFVRSPHAPKAETNDTLQSAKTTVHQLEVTLAQRRHLRALLGDHIRDTLVARHTAQAAVIREREIQQITSKGSKHLSRGRRC
jgi:hypothetical protein